MPSDQSESTVANELREQADRLSTLAEDLDRMEDVAEADEISYQIREGEVIIVRLAYYIADAEREGGCARRGDG